MANDPYAAFKVVPDGDQSADYSSFKSVRDDTPDPSYTQVIGKGLLSGVKGLANTADVYLPDGGKNNDYYLNNIHAGAKSIQSGIDSTLTGLGLNYDTPVSSKIQWNDPSTYSHLPKAALEALSSNALPAAAAFVPGVGPGLAAATVAGQNAGNYAQQAAQRAGHAVPTAQDKLAGAESGAVDGALNVALGPLSKLRAASGFGAGAGGLATQLIKDVPLAAGKGAVATGVTDAANQYMTTGKVNSDEALNAALTGAATGVGARALTVPGDIKNAIRMAPFGGANAGPSADLAKTMTSNGLDTNNLHNSGNAVARADDIHAGRASDALSNDQVQQHLDNNPGLADRVNDTLGNLKKGSTISEPAMTSLQKDLGPAGAAVSHNLRALNVSNNLKSMGYFSPGKFGGGIEQSALGRYTNPISFFGNSSHGTGVGAGIGIVGADRLIEHGINPTLLKFALGSVGVYPALTGLDRALGQRNPAQEFTRRFAGSQGANFTAPSPPAAPAAPVAPEPQGPGAASPLPNAALAQIAKNRMQMAQEQQGAAVNPPAPTVSQLASQVPNPATPEVPSGPASAPTSPVSEAYKQAAANAAMIQKAKAAVSIGGPLADPNGPTPEMISQGRADNRAFNSQETSAANNQNRAFNQAQRPQPAPAPEPQGPGAFGPLPNSALAQIAKNRMEQAPAAPSGLVVRSNGTGGTFNTGAATPPLTTIRSPSGKFSTQRDLSSAANPPAYTAAVQKALGIRENLGEALEKIAPNRVPEIAGFVNRMNNQSKSFQDASEHFEALVNDHLPASAQKAAFDAWNAHEAKIRGTFKQ